MITVMTPKEEPKVVRGYVTTDGCLVIPTGIGNCIMIHTEMTGKLVSESFALASQGGDVVTLLYEGDEVTLKF